MLAMILAAMTSSDAVGVGGGGVVIGGVTVGGVAAYRGAQEAAKRAASAQGLVTKLVQTVPPHLLMHAPHVVMEVVKSVGEHVSEVNHVYGQHTPDH